jgi:hypothetical protein
MVRKTAGEREKRKALDGGLKAMFRTLEKRPVSPEIHSTVDQLEAAAKPARGKARKA